LSQRDYCIIYTIAKFGCKIRRPKYPHIETILTNISLGLPNNYKCLSGVFTLYSSATSLLKHSRSFCRRPCFLWSWVNGLLRAFHS